MLLSRLKQEAHVWVIRPETVRDITTIDAAMSMLSKQERAQCQRFRFAEDRHHYLVSHALVRYLLSKYLDLPPDEWLFEKSEKGKPEIANTDVPPIRFNLSHTNGLAACIVTASCDCGIDVERIYSRHNPIGVAKRMFSDAEYKYMLELHGREQLEFFFSRWTLREAYVKARGIGISFPTRKLNFNIVSPSEINIEFQQEIQDKSEDWQLELLPLTTEHATAVAIRRDDVGDKKIVMCCVKQDLDSYVDTGLSSDPGLTPHVEFD